MTAEHIWYALLLVGITGIVILSFLGAGLYLRSRKELDAIQHPDLRNRYGRGQ